MAQSLKFLFLGFTSLLFVFHAVMSHRFCAVSYVKDVLTANCAYRGRLEVPPDLDPDIKILILSHNNIERISSNSFSRYTNLMKLYLNDNILLNNSMHKDVFLPLINLEVLDVSFMRYNVPFNLNWPPSVRKLAVSKNRNQDKISFSSLALLETLNSVDCTLTHFPEFNESALIKEIDLSRNPLNSFSIRDLAPLCQLEELRLQWTKDSTMNSSERWCDCLKIQTWINQHRIAAPNLNCTKPGIPKDVCRDKLNLPCGLTFDEETQIYEFCLEKSIKMGHFVRIIILAIIPIIIIICIWCLCL